MPMLAVIILAGGKSSRTNTTTPKIFLPLAGKPVIHYILATARDLKPLQIIVVAAPAFAHHPSFNDVMVAQQDQPLGTGHALMQAIQYLDRAVTQILVMFGDMPLVTLPSLKLLFEPQKSIADLCLMAMELPAQELQSPYGRFLCDDKGTLRSIVEWKDATPDQKVITLANSGVMMITRRHIEPLLQSIKNDNQAGEYYLTDLIAVAVHKNLHVHYVLGDFEDFQGINTLTELSAASQRIQKRLRQKMMENGVILIDPETIYFQADTVIGPDTTIAPHVVFGPEVRIEAGCQLLPYCYLEKTYMKSGAIVGPFTHLRGGCVIKEKAQIGNFVEAKGSCFGAGAKVKHLSYIGDADIGPGTNIGGGTITCNYDGYKKNRTTIGEHVFVGANTTFIAPIMVGNGAIIGAGSVITQDIAANSLGLSRAPQINNPDGATNYRLKKTKTPSL